MNDVAYSGNKRSTLGEVNIPAAIAPTLLGTMQATRDEQRVLLERLQDIRQRLLGPDHRVKEKECEKRDIMNHAAGVACDLREITNQMLTLTEELLTRV